MQHLPRQAEQLRTSYVHSASSNTAMGFQLKKYYKCYDVFCWFNILSHIL